MPYIKISDKDIYYEIHGKNNDNTLVYFHGGPGASCLDFTAQAKKLGSKLKVVIFDQYGVLRSERIMEDEAYGMNIQVKMVEEMREKLCIDKWSVLGHSYGGMLACLYTHTYPSTVNKLILDCPSLDFIDSSKSVAYYLSDYISKSGNNEAKALLQKIKTADYNDKTVFFDLMSLLEHIEDMQLRSYLHGITFEEYAKNVYTEAIPDEMWAKSETHLMKLIDEEKIIENFLPMLKNIRIPLLLINGRYDPACSENQIRYIKENIENVKQVLFENSGHFPRIEEPAKYTQCVIDFLFNQ